MNTKKPFFKPMFVIPLVLFIGVIVMLLFRLQQVNSDGDNPSTQDVVINTSVNKPVPSFNLPALADANKTIDNSQLPKTPYLLNVWGTWCIACSREHPLLLQLQQQGVTIVGVNYKDERDYANKYLNDSNPYLMNIYDEEGDLGIDLGLTGAPETFVIDGAGVIRQHIVGEVTNETINQQIQPCLTALADSTSNQANIDKKCV